MREFIIGRNGNQPFTITADGVSAEHLKLTISDDNNWFIEDLKGPDGNGTYIRDEKGNFIRVFKMGITEDTIIRLGHSGYHSCTFMAHHVLTDPSNYSYEFLYLKNLSRKWKQREEEQEAQNSKHMTWVKLAPLVGLLVSLLVTNAWLVRLFVTLPPAVAGLLFRDDSKKIKLIKTYAKNTLVCPHCGRPLSEFDINNMQCSICKAR